MLGRPAIIPCHWGTFPLLTGTPEQLIAEAPDGAVVHDIRPGDTVSSCYAPPAAPPTGGEERGRVSLLRRQAAACA